MTIPTLKRDAQVDVKISYNDAGCLANMIFFISKTWKEYTPEKLEQLKTILQNKEKIEDIDFHMFLCVDSLYKRILKAATAQDMIEQLDIKDAFNPLA